DLHLVVRVDLEVHAANGALPLRVAGVVLRVADLEAMLGEFLHAEGASEPAAIVAEGRHLDEIDVLQGGLVELHCAATASAPGRSSLSSTWSARSFLMWAMRL